MAESYREKITHTYCGVPVISPSTNPNYFNFAVPKSGKEYDNKEEIIDFNCQQQGPFISTGPKFFPKVTFNKRNPVVYSGYTYAVLRKNQFKIFFSNK